MNVVQRSRAQLANLIERKPQTASWYNVVRNDAGGPTRVDIYDEIGGGGWFNEGVNAADFVATLAGITGDLEIHINSPGGDVFEGLAIYNSIAQRPGNVTTVIDGLAASAASFIAQAGKTRIIAPGAMMMIHEASGLCIGNAADMRELAELLDKVSGNIASLYAERGGTADDWRAAMKVETWYTADEAVAAGLADSVAERPTSGALAAAAKFDLSAYLHAPKLTAATEPGHVHAATEAAGHGAFTGTHTHAHNSHDGPDADGDGFHGHEHSHDGEDHHMHSHDGMDGADGGVYGHAHTHLGDSALPLANKAMPVHHTATEDSAWDGPAAVAAMPNDASVLAYCHAWEDSAADDGTADDPDGDADDKKSAWKFPHHRTKGGPANLAACRNGLARLSNADIPDGDRAGVKAHLQAHLDDASKGDDDTHNHAGLPAWLTNKAAPLPAWLTHNAEEAK